MSTARKIFAPKFVDDAGQPIIASWSLVGKESLLFLAFALFVSLMFHWISTFSDFVVLIVSGVVYVFVLHVFSRMSRNPALFITSATVAITGLRVLFFYLSLPAIVVLFLKYLVEGGRGAGAAGLLLLPGMAMALFAIFPATLLALGFFWFTTHQGLVWANRRAAISRWFTLIFVVFFPSIILIGLLMARLLAQ